MQLLLGLAFVLLTAAAAWRFLSLAWRTRRPAELMLGLTALCLGLSMALGALTGEAPDSGLYYFAVSLTAAGSAAYAGFVVALMGRSASRGAIAGALIAVALLPTAWYIVEGALPSSTFAKVKLALAALPFAWSGVEFSGYARQLARRARLGIGDPGACSAFRMLSVGSIALFLTYLVRVVPTDLPIPVLEGVQLCIGWLAAGAFWGGLAPPHWLRRRWERAHAG